MVEALHPLVLQEPTISDTVNAGLEDHQRQPNNVHHSEPQGISL